MTDPFKDYLGTAALAARFGVSQGRVKTVIAETLRGERAGSDALPSQLFGGRRYVHVRDADAYQAARRPGGRPQKPTTHEERQEKRRASAREASARRRAAAKAST